jgi:hypothetical protein
VPPRFILPCAVAPIGPALRCVAGNGLHMRPRNSLATQPEWIQARMITDVRRRERDYATEHKRRIPEVALARGAPMARQGRGHIPGFRGAVFAELDVGDVSASNVRRLS